MSRRISKGDQSGKFAMLNRYVLPVILVTCACILSGSATFSTAQSLPDLTGSWNGVDWGEVVLERIGRVSYVGTYSDTYGKDAGRITFSFVAGKYEGKWWGGYVPRGCVNITSFRGRAYTSRYMERLSCQHDKAGGAKASFIEMD